MDIILNSFGITLQKENNLFCVNSHKGKKIIPPRDVSSISISKGARISSDAVLLAIEHEVDVFFIDKSGMPKGRIWSNQYGSISTIRKNQLEFIYSGKSVDWIKETVSYKMDNQIAMLLLIQNNDKISRQIVKNAINAIADYKSKVLRLDGVIVADIAPSLRGWEGASSKRYFKALSEHLPQEFQFERRTQNPATDKFNALLNYGYGILYSKIEGALIKAGLDPYIGILHRDDYNRPVLVYDVIERYRIWVDFVAFKLCQEDAFSDDCFTILNGGTWLDGLGKRIYIQAIHDYLSEIITLEALDRSRETHINLYSQKLTKIFSR